MGMKLSSGFAHLLGKASRAEDDDEEKKDAKKSRADDDDPDRDDDKSRRADEDDDQDDDDDKKESKKSRAEDDDESDEDSKRGKKSKSRSKAEADDEDEDDEDDEDDESDDKKEGRRAERARCAAIFKSKAASGRPDLAAQLAFGTNLSVKEARAIMGTVGPISMVRGISILDRMAAHGQTTLGPDSGAAAGSVSSTAAAILAAVKKVGH